MPTLASSVGVRDRTGFSHRALTLEHKPIVTSLIAGCGDELQGPRMADAAALHLRQRGVMTAGMRPRGRAAVCPRFANWL